MITSEEVEVATIAALLAGDAAQFVERARSAHKDFVTRYVSLARLLLQEARIQERGYHLDGSPKEKA